MKSQEPQKQVTSIPVVGLSMAVGMGIMAWVGVLVDKKFLTSPWGMLGGVGLGLFYCGYEFWKLIQQSKAEEKGQ